MTRLSPAAYLGYIDSESARFRDVLADCDPAAPVPSCPGWRAADLLWHLGGDVQHWWAWLIENRPKSPEDGYVAPKRPGDYAGLLAFYDEQHATLVAALDGIDPATDVWTWSGDPGNHTAGFVLRRQAHEALIHRRDAELTAGKTTAFPTDLAADGVEEVLDVMYGGCPPWGEFSPLSHYLRLDLTDTGDRVWVQLGRFHGTDPDGVTHEEEDLHVVADPGVEPEAVISGTAEVLDTRLWRRADGAGTHLAGDTSLVDRFREIVSTPIN